MTSGNYRSIYGRIFENEKLFNNIAISDHERSVSYLGLKKEVDILAALIEAEHTREIPVLILCNRSIENIIAMLACLKIGYMYVPLDGSSSDEFIEFIKNSTNSNFVCDQNFIRETLKKKDYIVHNNLTDIEPRVSAYAIFTSGSTGSPKGVEISCESLYFHVSEMVKLLSFNSDTVTLCMLPLQFDASAIDVFGTLFSGGKLVLQKEFLLPSEVWLTGAENEITHISFSATAGTLLTGRFSKIQKYKNEKLQSIKIGAEKCSIELINELKCTYPDVKYFHTYGPTETTCVSHCYEIKNPVKSLNGRLSIGYPIGTVSAIVVTEKMERTRPFEIGELLIGGVQVMKGYYKDPVRTSNALISINQLGLYYKTGDYVLLDDDGACYFVERRDDLVKVSGYLVSLNEIELKIIDILFQFGHITKGTQVVCLFNDDIYGGDIFAGIFIDSVLEIGPIIAEQFRKTMPSYKNPGVVRQYKEQELPLLASGKIDKNAIRKRMAESIRGS